MGKLFPGKKRFLRKDERGNVISEWTSSDLDWRAKVVCKECNNTWMSDIENRHAKPALTDLILGRLDLNFSVVRANSLALFAFKTAVIFDHIAKGREPFFSRASRHLFRASLAISPAIQMWMAGFLPMGKGEVLTSYHGGKLSPTNSVQLYVCTYAVGHFAFQTVAQKQSGLTAFRPLADRFDHLAVPFFPLDWLPRNLVWPVGDVLRDPQDFEQFSLRWKNISIRR